MFMDRDSQKELIFASLEAKRLLSEATFRSSGARNFFLVTTLQTFRRSAARQHLCLGL
jgi:hypothetical protein